MAESAEEGVIQSARSDAVATSTDAQPNSDPAVSASARSLREERRWSGLPIAASLALVAFAVVFGVYGPRVVDRGSPQVGTPLWEAVDAAVEHLDQYILHAPFRQGEVVAMGEVNAELTTILRMPLACPDLTEHDFVPCRPQALRIPGASDAAVVVFSRGGKNDVEYLSLVIAPYREQYTLFSDFGRPQFLVPGGAIGVDAAPSDRVASSTLAWTNGSLLFVAAGSRRTTLGDVAPDLVPFMTRADEGS